MNADIRTSVPLQYRSTLTGRLLRAALRTQIGKRLAFSIGLKGFNRVVHSHFKYVRDWDGEKLRTNEILKNIQVGNEVIARVFRAPRVGIQFNARVNVGAALQASLMSGATFGGLTSPAVPKYIALSGTTLTPAATDTTLSGELTTGSLGRASGAAQNYVAPVSLDGAASYNIFNQFTNTGGSTLVASTALFDALTTGNMFAEVNFSSTATMATNDLLQVTWTVNI